MNTDCSFDLQQRVLTAAREFLASLDEGLKLEGVSEEMVEEIWQFLCLRQPACLPLGFEQAGRATLRRWWPNKEAIKTSRRPALALWLWLQALLAAGQEEADVDQKNSEADSALELAFQPLPAPSSLYTSNSSPALVQEIVNLLEDSMNHPKTRASGVFCFREFLFLSLGSFRMYKGHLQKARDIFSKLRGLCKDQPVFQIIRAASALSEAELLAHSNLPAARELLAAAQTSLPPSSEGQTHPGTDRLQAQLRGALGRIEALAGKEMEGLRLMAEATEFLGRLEESQVSVRPTDEDWNSIFANWAAASAGGSSASLWLQLGRTYWDAGGEYRTERQYCHR